MNVPDQITGIVDRPREWWTEAPQAQKMGAAGGAAAVVIALIVALMTMSGEEEDWNPAILYTDLDYWEAAEITNRLTALGIPYKLTQDATAITVPDDQVRDLRLSLAGDGFPKSGTIGYEYRKAAALAAGFREARGDVTVTMDSDLLVMPEESLFADEVKEHVSDSVPGLGLPK